MDPYGIALSTLLIEAVNSRISTSVVAPRRSYKTTALRKAIERAVEKHLVVEVISTSAPARKELTGGLPKLPVSRRPDVTFVDEADPRKYTSRGEFVISVSSQAF
jgi:hypothetical protein